MPGLPGRGRGSPARRTTAPGVVLVNYAAVCGLLSATVWPSPCPRFQKSLFFLYLPVPSLAPVSTAAWGARRRTHVHATPNRCGDRHKQRAMLYHQQVSLWGAVLSVDAGMPHPPERWLATQPPPSHAHPTHARHVTAQADSQKRRKRRRGKSEGPRAPRAAPPPQSRTWCTNACTPRPLP